MKARPIVANSTNDGRIQPADIIFQNLESFTIAVAGDDNTTVFHELRQISCFAAWCSTSVEDSFSWLRIEKLTRDCCAGILNVVEARIESGRWQGVKFYKTCVAR